LRAWIAPLAAWHVSKFFRWKICSKDLSENVATTRMTRRGHIKHAAPTLCPQFNKNLGCSGSFEMARAVDTHQLIREIDQQAVNIASRKITRERIGDLN
jgi:hypothetical protein